MAGDKYILFIYIYIILVYFIYFIYFIYSGFALINYHRMESRAQSCLKITFVLFRDVRINSNNISIYTSLGNWQKMYKLTITQITKVSYGKVSRQHHGGAIRPLGLKITFSIASLLLFERNMETRQAV